MSQNVNILPASNIINVTITETPSGLTEKNVNSLALFTQDPPTNGEKYGIYISASQVAANYGTASKTAAMANNIFAQAPNILAGEGRLVIIPMAAAVSATHEKVETSNISANLAAILAVTNGSLTVHVNGAAQALVGINFSQCQTWSDIAALLNGLVVDADVYALTAGNGIGFGSHRVGTASLISLSGGGGGTDLDGAGYFNGAAATTTAGVNSSGETIAACIARTSLLVGYVPIITTLDLEDAAVLAAASAVQALDNMFLHHFACTTDIAGVITTIALAGQKKTRCLLYTVGLSAANLMKSAYAGRGYSVDFTGSLTSQTMNLKPLANVDPDGGISETLYVAAQAAGADLYVNFDGVPSVVSNGGNDYFDNPYSDLAAKFALVVAGFNYLRQTNTKVPQTEPGMDGLKDAYRQVCDQFVTNGCWAPGQWDTSETFGNQAIFLNNITNKGYYLFSQPIAQQAASQRDARIAPLVQGAAKRAGAIQQSSVLFNINA